MVRSKRIFFANNTPFIVWTLYAVYRALVPELLSWQCPVKAIFGFCPGCGLTSSYVRLIKGGGINSIWFLIIYTGFIINLIYSLIKIYRINTVRAAK